MVKKLKIATEIQTLFWSGV